MFCSPEIRRPKAETSDKNLLPARPPVLSAARVIRLPGGSVFRKYGGRYVGLLFSYSYPFVVLTPAPQSGFTRPSLASTAPLWLLSSLTWGQQNPETEEVVPVARVVHGAERRPAAPGEVVPATPVAAAKHAVRARRRPLGVNGNPAGIGVEPVLTPFIDIPVHVIQPPRVW